MTLETQINIHSEDLQQVVGSIFSTMLGMSAEPGAQPPEFPSSAEVMTAAVCLIGATQAAVALQCLPRQACEFAGSFLGMPAPDGVDSDVRDVLAELVNMIAGNLKCTLEPGTRLSIPSVVDGEPPGLFSKPPEFRFGFATEKGSLWLTVVGAPSLT